MALTHIKWEKNGRTQQDEQGRLVYTSKVGQLSVDTGGENYVPYVWDEVAQTLRYCKKIIEFHSGGYQVLKDYDTGEVLIDDQRFEVQYWRPQGGGQWRVLDLYDQTISVDEQDDQCIVTVRRFDGSGNELLITFLVRPHRKVKLTFQLTVVDAGLYRIRFQNTGIAGELTERIAKDRNTGATLGVYRILFEKIFFEWDLDEIAIHEGYTVETQAQGKKLDFFLGEFDLPDDGSVIISPTTWGPTTTSDDCDQYGTTYEDDYSGEIYVGSTGGSILHIGWIWSNVTIAQGVTIDAGTKITVTAGGQNGSGADAKLKAVDEHPPTAWGTGALHIPSECTTYEGTEIDWDLNQASGNHDSPELNVLFAQITDDGGWSSGDACAIVWMSNSASGSNNQAITADDATLTVVYTAGGAAVAPTSVLNGPLVGPLGGPI